MEIYSTRHAELAKTGVAAFSSSLSCVGKRNGPTTTLFLKRTTKRSVGDTVERPSTCPRSVSGVCPLIQEPGMQTVRETARGHAGGRAGDTGEEVEQVLSQHPELFANERQPIH